MESRLKADENEYYKKMKLNNKSIINYLFI